MNWDIIKMGKMLQNSSKKEDKCKVYEGKDEVIKN